MIDKLKDAIEIEIILKEDLEQLTLSMEEKEFLLNTLTDYVRRSISKYIAGSQEHGDGFLTDVEHLNEAMKEVVDLTFYIAAAQSKAAK